MHEQVVDLIKNKENELIILFSRFPRAGQSKTRLIPHLGAEGAALFQKEMTEFIAYECFLTQNNVQVHFNASTKEEMQTWIKESIALKFQNKNISKNFDEKALLGKIENKFDFVEQDEGDLGQKMKSAFLYAYQELCKKNQIHSKKKILIIGSDCPSIRKELLEKAFLELETKSCVIGKSLDGGYYLLGGAFEKEEELEIFLNLFDDITWSTEKVYAETIGQIKKNNLDYADLMPLMDIDYKEDIPPKVSIIIPTYNEEKNIVEFFENLPSSFNTEYIVIDGKSSDNTFAMAQKYADKVILCEKGRSMQMHNGAQEASGEILLFLHIDSFLPHSFDSKIRDLLEESEISLGYFDFAFKEDAQSALKNTWWGKFICGCANLRSKYLKRPYGDQGLFVRKKDYYSWKLPIVPILEDVFLVKKALEYGKIQSLKEELQTSDRRWVKHGFFKVTFINQSVLLAAKIGMDLEKIQDCYWSGKNPLFEWIRRK